MRYKFMNENESSKISITQFPQENLFKCTEPWHMYWKTPIMFSSKNTQNHILKEAIFPQA